MASSESDAGMRGRDGYDDIHRAQLTLSVSLVFRSAERSGERLIFETSGPLLPRKLRSAPSLSCGCSSRCRCVWFEWPSGGSNLWRLKSLAAQISGGWDWAGPLPSGWSELSRVSAAPSFPSSRVSAPLSPSISPPLSPASPLLQLSRSAAVPCPALPCGPSPLALRRLISSAHRLISFPPSPLLPSRRRRLSGWMNEARGWAQAPATAAVARSSSHSHLLLLLSC